MRQLTQLAKSIRAHLGKFGLVVPKGVHNMNRLVTEAEAAALPTGARMPLDLLAQQFRDTKTRIDAINADLRRAAEADKTARRLQVMPGIAPSRQAFWQKHCRTCRPSVLPAICRPGWA